MAIKNNLITDHQMLTAESNSSNTIWQLPEDTELWAQYLPRYEIP